MIFNVSLMSVLVSVSHPVVRMLMRMTMTLMMVMTVLSMSMRMHDVTMFMRMAFMTCSAKKTTNLMRSKIRNHLQALLKFECNPFNMVCLHNGKHDFLIYSERHINLRTFHYCGPVLITDGVSKFDSHPYDSVVVFTRKFCHIHHKNRTQFYAEHCSFISFRIKGDDITINNLRVASQSYGIFLPADAFPKETRFLSGPLVEEYKIYFGILEFLFPFRRNIHIAENLIIYFHFVKRIACFKTKQGQGETPIPSCLLYVLTLQAVQ